MQLRLQRTGLVIYLDDNMAVDLTKINAINTRAQQLLSKPVSTVTPAPTQQAPPAPIQPKQNIFQKAIPAVKNFGQKAVRALQIPSEVTEKGITSLYGKNNYEDVYRQNKVPEPIVKPLAFGARMLLDPLNLIGSVIKPLQIASKVTRVTGIARKVAPIVSKAKAWLNPALNLTDTQQYILKMIPRKAGARAEQYMEKMKPLVEGLSTQGRTAAALLLQKSKDAEKTLKALKFPEREAVLRFVKEADTQRIDQLKRAYGLGMITKKEFTDLSKNVAKYYHSTFDTAKPNVLQRIFGGVTTSGSYWRKKLGKMGQSLDAPLAVAKREAKQMFDEEKAKVLWNVRRNKDLAVKALKAPEGFIKVTGEYLKGHQMLKGYSLRKDVFDALIDTEKISRLPGGNMLRAFNKVWKPIVTAYNPAFHAQNLMGNLSQMALSGIRNPKRFLQATFGGKTISAAERAIAKAGGVLNSGQVMESLGKNLGDTKKVVNKVTGKLETIVGDVLPDVSQLGNKNILQQLGQRFKETKVGGVLDKLNPRNWGNAIEDNARTAMYNEAYNKAIKAGKTAAQAAQEAFTHTNKFLFDYATGLGPREKQLRDFFPFYSWTRFNMPLQLEQLLKQPQFYAAAGKLSRTMEPEREGMPGERGYSLPTPLKDKEGNQVRWQPNLPGNALFDMAQPGKTLMNMVSPLAKDAVTLAGNIGGAPTGQYNFGGFNGKPIIPPGFSPEGKVRAVLEYLKGRIRPFKDVESSAKLGGLPGILKYLMGGMTVENPERDALNQVYEQSNLRSRQNKELQSAIQSGDEGYINRLRSRR